MIFRKPYAFFIKYFRIINLVIAVLMAVLIYHTFRIGKFLTDYINDYIMATDGFDLSNYINFYIFLLTLLVIILTIVVTSVMFVKNKPKKLYLFNLLVYISLVVLYMVDYNVMHDIYDRILDIRVSKALRDINYIAVGVQIVSFLAMLVRSTGFDIKKFDFGKDLQELEIDVKDNEEFEVAVEFDKNKIRRNARNKIRKTKYFYVEHKFLINVILIVFIVVITFTIFVSKTIYQDNHSQNQIFSASEFQFNVKNSYITKTDQNENEVTSGALVIVKVDVRKFNDDEKKYLNTGLITLRIENNSYAITNKYNGYLTDVGTAYTNDNLSTDFTSYIFIFEIPESQMHKSMKLKINDNISYVRGQIGAKNIFVKLKPLDLTNKEQSEDKRLGDTLSFSGSMLGETTFSVTKYEIANKFKIEYNFCSKKDRCNTSYEYVTPTATGNYFKTLMKVDGTFEEDETMNLEDVDDIYYFLNKYATINYKINNNWYEHKINSKLVKPKIGNDNYYYIEVNKDIEKATSIYLRFNVRNYTYKYILK